LSLALYTGDSGAAAPNLHEGPAKSERATCAAIRSDAPDLLPTKYKQLEFLLVRYEDWSLLTRLLRYLVLDEVHSHRGALATEIACLIRRLKAHALPRPGELVGIGTSATVAAKDGGTEAPARFARALFGEPISVEDIIGERLVVRKKRAVGFDFIQEHIDPSRKRRYHEHDIEPYNVSFRTGIAHPRLLPSITLTTSARHGGL